MIRLNSRKALPFLLLHCWFPIEFNSLFRRLSWAIMKDWVKWSRAFIHETLYFVTFKFSLRKMNRDKTKLFNCSNTQWNFIHNPLQTVLHVFYIENCFLIDTTRIWFELAFSACCHLITDHTIRDRKSFSLGLELKKQIEGAGHEVCFAVLLKAIAWDVCAT